MCWKGKLLLALAALLLLGLGVTGAVRAFVPTPVEAPPVGAPPEADEYRRTVEAMRPPKGSRPLVAVLGDNRGTEAIDFLVPYGVLKESGLADVFAVAMQEGPLKLRPALTIRSHITAAQLDARYPDGADYVIVPAMYDHETPEVIAWIKSQAARGATIVAVCSGAEILAHGGLLRNRAATSHWTSIEMIRAAGARWVAHRRYVADRGIVTTTGVSAAIPVSIALVEAIGGAQAARRVADRLGIGEWGLAHDSAGSRLGNDFWTGIGNKLAFWGYEDVGVPVAEGVSDVALVLAADAWARTYRSRALTVAASRTVRTRYGIELIVDRWGERPEVDRRLPAPEEGRPAHALDTALSQIAAAYGPGTGRLIAVQLEYQPGR